MSFLSPLFLLGAAAILGPIVFHLIRRVTREKIPFGSLMFLQPSPPRLTRKSRLEHILLLLLRCLALILLAMAFARPYFANDQQIELDADEQVHHCLLVDMSASMRREGAWEQVLTTSEKWLNQWKDQSMVHIFFFDESLVDGIRADQWASLSPENRTATSLNLIRSQSPSWRTTAIDTALLEAIHQMEEASREQDQETQQASWELVVISDLQEGASYEGLREQDWPKHAYVFFEPISPQYIGNASLQVLQSPWHLNADGESFSPRLRLATSGDAEQDQYELSWGVSADKGTDFSTSLPIYLPPGKARIMDGPSMDQSVHSHRLLLSGDKDSFDNVAWLAPFKPRRSEIGIITRKDLKRPQEGLDLYAQGAFQSIPGHKITLQIYGPDEASRIEQAASTDLWLVHTPLSEKVADQCLERCRKGERLLIPIVGTEMESTLQRLWPDPSLTLSEAALQDYALLASIDFQHPLFAPFADPRYNDFSKIHFWKHHLVIGPDWEDPALSVPALFDNRQPAWIIKSQGRGKMFVLTSSWAPKDSQLALSTKFVPLLHTILEEGNTTRGLETQYSVGDKIDSNAWKALKSLSVTRPDGVTDTVLEGQGYSQTHEPGLYTVKADGLFEWTFAVNMSSQEGRTQPLPVETFEGLGILTKRPEQSFADRVKEEASREASTRLLKAREIEGQQQYWKWALCAVLLLLTGETYLAGRTLRRQAV